MAKATVKTTPKKSVKKETKVKKSAVKKSPAKKAVKKSSKSSKSETTDNDDEDDEKEENEDNHDEDNDEQNDDNNDGNSNNGDDEEGGGSDNDDQDTKSKKRKPSAKKQKVVAKKGKKDTKPIKKSTASSSSSGADQTTTTRGQKKPLSKLEKLEEARKAFKWWEAPDLPEGINWQYLENAGMVFAPAYIPHNIPMSYNGEVIILTPEQEEMATFYASIPEDGPQLGNEQTRIIFQNNFFDTFKQSFPSNNVKDFKKCDFTLIKQHLELQKNLKKASTNEEKQHKKNDKELLQLQYGYALVDGRLEKVGNYNMEPPGLFRGRGVHPKTGTIKQRYVV